MSETEITKEVRLEYAKSNITLWRNNVGACIDSHGNVLRYGLANDSKAMSDNIKSSDLIGIRPVVITQDMVGQTIGQFMAIEVKRPGWVYKGTKREQAQLKFINLVNSLGGHAAFLTPWSD